MRRYKVRAYSVDLIRGGTKSRTAVFHATDVEELEELVGSTMSGYAFEYRRNLRWRELEPVDRSSERKGVLGLVKSLPGVVSARWDHSGSGWILRVNCYGSSRVESVSRELREYNGALSDSGCDFEYEVQFS